MRVRMNSDLKGQRLKSVAEFELLRWYFTSELTGGQRNDFVQGAEKHVSDIPTSFTKSLSTSHLKIIFYT